MTGELSARQLSIVIPTRHRWDTLRVTLAALAEQTDQDRKSVM